MRIWTSIIAAALLHLPACAPAASKQLLIVTVERGEGCRLRMAEQTFTLPEDAAAFTDHANKLRPFHSRATMKADASTPYKCIGHLMWLLQRAGFRVEFIAEPPPAQVTRE